MTLKLSWLTIVIRRVKLEDDELGLFHFLLNPLVLKREIQMEGDSQRAEAGLKTLSTRSGIALSQSATCNTSSNPRGKWCYFTEQIGGKNCIHSFITALIRKCRKMMYQFNLFSFIQLSLFFALAQLADPVEGQWVPIHLIEETECELGSAVSLTLGVFGPDVTSWRN